MYEFKCLKWDGHFWCISFIKDKRESRAWKKVLKLHPEKVSNGQTLWLLINDLYVPISIHLGF